MEVTEEIIQETGCEAEEISREIGETTEETGGITKNIGDKIQVNKEMESITTNAVASTLSTVTNGLFFTKLGREALFAGTMYMAGGAVISTVGLLPVVATGAAIYYFS